jgi:hypothetical protein
MDRLLRAENAARHLDGAIGDHLVHVHVALRAAAGLPDAQREVVVELAGGDLIRGADDEIGQSGLSLPRSWFTSAQAFFSVPKAWITSSGIRSSPMSKWISDRAVCAP